MSSRAKRRFPILDLLACAVLAASTATAAQAGDENLVTPSGNIVCSVVEDAGDLGNFIACEVRERTNTTLLQPRPADCDTDMDWGSSFTVPEKGQAELNCHHGGTLPAPNSIVLNYGTVFRFHGIACESEKAGLTCRNGDGHGFSISRSEQRLF